MPSVVLNVFGIAQVAEMLWPLMAGMVALPRLPLGEVVGLAIRLAPLQ
jgi:hypothetical protein